MNDIAKPETTTAPNCLADLQLTKPSGLISRVALMTDQQFCEIAQAMTCRQLKRVRTQCESLVGRCKSKILESRMTIGAALTVCQHLHEKKRGGGFRELLEASNLERTQAYRCIRLFAFLGPYCADENSTGFLSRFSLEAALLLASPTTDDGIRQRFVSQAQQGESVTHKAVKQAIAQLHQQTLPQDELASAEEPWLDRVYRDGRTEIHYTIDRSVTREELTQTFKAALNDCYQQLQLRLQSKEGDGIQ